MTHMKATIPTVGAVLLRVIWCSACVMVLVWSLVAAANAPSHLRHHADEALAIWLAVLTFPVGVAYYIALTLLLMLVYSVTGTSIGGGPIFAVLVAWLPAVILGYWQWFVLLPRYLSRRREAGRA